MRVVRKSVLIFGVVMGLMLGYLAVFPVPTTSYMDSERARLGYLKHDWVQYRTLPPMIGATVIAAEDSGFCAHHGVEWGILWEVMKTGADRGGSTISQQMVKNVLLWQGQSRLSKYVRKAIEIPLTLIVDLLYSKKRILELYINSIEYDTGVFGIEEAALHHFKVHAKDLSARQMALLASVLPSPKKYQAVPAGAYVTKRAGQIERGANDVLATELSSCIR